MPARRAPARLRVGAGNGNAATRQSSPTGKISTCSGVASWLPRIVSSRACTAAITCSASVRVRSARVDRAKAGPVSTAHRCGGGPGKKVQLAGAAGNAVDTADGVASAAACACASCRCQCRCRCGRGDGALAVRHAQGPARFGHGFARNGLGIVVELRPNRRPRRVRQPVLRAGGLAPGAGCVPGERTLGAGNGNGLRFRRGFERDWAREGASAQALHRRGPTLPRPIGCGSRRRIAPHPHRHRLRMRLRRRRRRVDLARR